MIFLSLVVLLVIFLVVPRDPSRFLNFTGTYSPLVSFLLDRIVSDILPAGWTLIGFRLNEPLEVLLVASLILALGFDMPVIAYETYRFIDPALTESERSMVYPFVLSSSTLFAVGMLFGYYILVKFIFISMAPFFVSTHASFTIDLADFYFVIFMTVLASGVAFTAPVFVFALLRFGVVDVGFFAKNRVLIWFGVYIVTAITTPDGGPLVDVVLFLPIIALLELSIFLGRRYSGHRETTQKGKGGRCLYCGSSLGADEVFCSNCHRSAA